MDDAGGRPSQDGGEPDDDRGGADEDFATVVFDEEFVRAARIHEPTAVERLVAAAEARAEAEAARSRPAGTARDGDPYDRHRPGREYAEGRTPTTRTTSTTTPTAVTSRRARTARTAAPCAPTGAPRAGTGRSPGSWRC